MPATEHHDGITRPSRHPHRPASPTTPRADPRRQTRAPASSSRSTKPFAAYVLPEPEGADDRQALVQRVNGRAASAIRCRRPAQRHATRVASNRLPIRGHQATDGRRADLVKPRHLAAGLPPRHDVFRDVPPLAPRSASGAAADATPARAAARPAEVRSRIMARSNSAKAPTICIIIRPAGVVVSMLSVTSGSRRRPRRSAP